MRARRAAHWAGGRSSQDQAREQDDGARRTCNQHCPIGKPYKADVGSRLVRTVGTYVII